MPELLPFTLLDNFLLLKLPSQRGYGWGRRRRKPKLWVLVILTFIFRWVRTSKVRPLLRRAMKGSGLLLRPVLTLTVLSWGTTRPCLMRWNVVSASTVPVPRLILVKLPVVFKGEVLRLMVVVDPFVMASFRPIIRVFLFLLIILRRLKLFRLKPGLTFFLTRLVILVVARLWVPALLLIWLRQNWGLMRRRPVLVVPVLMQPRVVVRRGLIKLLVRTRILRKKFQLKNLVRFILPILRKRKVIRLFIRQILWGVELIIVPNVLVMLIRRGRCRNVVIRVGGLVLLLVQLEWVKKLVFVFLNRR